MWILLEALRFHRLTFHEDQPPGARIDHDRVALEKIALEDAQCQRVEHAALNGPVGSSRVDLQACKLEYSIVSPK